MLRGFFRIPEIQKHQTAKLITAYWYRLLSKGIFKHNTAAVLFYSGSPRRHNPYPTIDHEFKQLCNKKNLTKNSVISLQKMKFSAEEE